MKVGRKKKKKEEEDRKVLLKLLLMQKGTAEFGINKFVLFRF